MFEPNTFDSTLHYLLQKTPENAVDFLQRDDEFERFSGTDIREAPSGDDDLRPKKKRYHRHTRHQIQEMEAVFKECPNPDDKQRSDLARRFGMDPFQVKFWFQNKRTQMKTQQERHENAQLRNEIEKLLAENKRYKEALYNSTCPNCGGPVAATTETTATFDEQHLRVKIDRLREEIDRISGIAAKYVGKPNHTDPPRGQADANSSPHQGIVGGVFGASDLLRPTEADKSIIVELAVASMEEFIRMARAGEPLWVPSSDNSTASLTEDEYLRMFPRRIGYKPVGLRSEASRESAVVLMNHINLVEILMDVHQWSSMFMDIVSRARTLKVLSTGVAGNYNGALQVLIAEYQVPSPLVPTRENYFVRYCKQHAEGTWAVVDVSLDNLRPTSLSRCRRRPSGCLIEEMPNGYSKVTWVEHVEVDDRAVHNIYRSLITSGLAFGAKRWVATLDRQCERLASAQANNIPADIGVITTAEGRQSLLKLAERMVVSFCSGVSTSTAHTWTTLPGSGADDVRVKSRKSTDDPVSPPGLVLSAATSFWIPASPKRVFEYLRDENSRSKWDILSNGGQVQEMAHIANGRDPGNCVSLLRVNGAKSSQSNMVILQESCSDSTGSYVIYAPVDIIAMNVVLSGNDPYYVAPLPSGFSTLPDGPGQQGGEILEVGSGGSLVTIVFQVLVDSVPAVKLSLGSAETVKRLIKLTVERIKAAVASDNT